MKAFAYPDLRGGGVADSIDDGSQSEEHGRLTIWMAAGARRAQRPRDMSSIRPGQVGLQIEPCAPILAARRCLRRRIDADGVEGCGDFLHFARAALAVHDQTAHRIVRRIFQSMPSHVSCSEENTLSSASCGAAAMRLRKQRLDAFDDDAAAHLDGGFIGPSMASGCMPKGAIISTNRCAAGPPTSIGTRWPYGCTGAMTAASTKAAPAA